MPAYNAAGTIAQAVESVISQTYENWELLIVDDCSTDGTAELVRREYADDGRIRLIDNAANRGVSKSRNIAIELADGEYIAFLDSDDWWEPGKLQEQLALMDATGAKCCHSHYRRISGETGAELSVVRAPRRVTLRDMYLTNQIGNLTGIYRTAALGKFFQPEVRHEDYAMWLSILKVTDSVCVDNVLANYRVARHSLSGNKIRSLMWHYLILRDSLQLPRFKAACYTIAHVLTVVWRRR